jgi:hypothetical protein
MLVRFADWNARVLERRAAQWRRYPRTLTLLWGSLIIYRIAVQRYKTNEAFKEKVDDSILRVRDALNSWQEALSR